MIKDVHAAFDSFPGAARPIAQAIEGMDQCIARRAIFVPELRAWLGGLKLPRAQPAPAPAPKAHPKRR